MHPYTLSGMRTTAANSKAGQAVTRAAAAHAKTTADLRAALVAGREAGLSFRQLQAASGMHFTTIRAWLLQPEPEQDGEAV